MRIKENFMLRQVVDTYVVLPLCRSVLDFNGMLSLNETGAFLWKQLERGATRETLADALTAEYDVSRAEALADIDAFIASLAPVGCIEE